MGGDRIQSLYRAIVAMCQTHGVVVGLFGLAVDALGQEYSHAYRRVCALEKRGLVHVQRRGHGRPMLITAERRCPLRGAYRAAGCPLSPDQSQRCPLGLRHHSCPLPNQDRGQGAYLFP